VEVDAAAFATTGAAAGAVTRTGFFTENLHLMSAGVFNKFPMSAAFKDFLVCRRR